MNVYTVRIISDVIIADERCRRHELSAHRKQAGEGRLGRGVGGVLDSTTLDVKEVRFVAVSFEVLFHGLKIMNSNCILFDL